MTTTATISRGAAKAPRTALAATILVGLLADAGAAWSADAAVVCESTAAKSLSTCVKKISAADRKCYLATGAACSTSDKKVTKALAGLETKIAKKCPSDTVVQDAGYGPMLTQQALVDRMKGACTAEVSSLAARSFGGPHGAALGTASAEGRDCLETTHKQGAGYLTKSAKLQSKCVVKTRKGGACDLAKTTSKIDALAAKAEQTVAEACEPAAGLSTVVAVGHTDFVARTGAQGRCMTATSHADATPLSLDCGPRTAIATPSRGTYMQVTLDESEFGTRCGDGSPFAFWIRLAPEGYPVENVVVHMQGGGVCIFEADCASRSADLFEALSDPPATSGIMSNDELVSPFANWTKVYLPYCNQDVFIGGGTTSDWPSVTVHRYGALNVRTAMRYVRDVIWRELDQTTTEGYRNDRPTTLFGGTSAGGFGTLFNYHWMLDDLQWPHTSAWPDAALSLDNGEVLGIVGLGALLISNSPPFGWSAQPYLPPYCFSNTCAAGPTGYVAHAPRLKAVPEQQFLILSNQVDDTQVNTTFFDTEVEWINTARQSYCDTAGLNGIRYFLPAITASTHVIATRESLYTTYSVDGEIMRDWLGGAMSTPDGVVDRVEEGTLTTDIPGVAAFPCTLP